MRLLNVATQAQEEFGEQMENGSEETLAQLGEALCSGETLNARIVRTAAVISVDLILAARHVRIAHAKRVEILQERLVGHLVQVAVKLLALAVVPGILICAYV